MICFKHDYVPRSNPVIPLRMPPKVIVVANSNKECIQATVDNHDALSEMIIYTKLPLTLPKSTHSLWERCKRFKF